MCNAEIISELLGFWTPLNEQWSGLPLSHVCVGGLVSALATNFVSKAFIKFGERLPVFIRTAPLRSAAY
jgi:hypothetical protein